MARFVRAIRIDNEKIKVEGILIDCREATGEFGNFDKILSRQEMQLHPCKESKESIKVEEAVVTGNFLQAPAGLERCAGPIIS